MTRSSSTSEFARLISPARCARRSQNATTFPATITLRSWLDTFNDKRRAYVLLFNPLGVQGDGVFTEGQAIDFSVDVVMQSKGLVTDDGYTVEVAVPFTSLRYEAGEGKRWGVHVLRIVRHLDEWDTWMPVRRESRDFRTATFTQFLEQAGHITGIENVGRERTLELIPTFAFLETGRRVSPSPASVGVLRLKHDLGAQSSAGVIATCYNFVERHNQLIGVDGRFAVDSNTILTRGVIISTMRTSAPRPHC